MHHLANAMWWARVDWKENYCTTFHGEALPNITKHCIAKDYHRAEKVRNSAGVARITHAGASFWPRSTQKGFCNASDANEEKKKGPRDIDIHKTAQSLPFHSVPFLCGSFRSEEKKKGPRDIDIHKTAQSLPFHSVPFLCGSFRSECCTPKICAGDSNSNVPIVRRERVRFKLSWRNLIM